MKHEIVIILILIVLLVFMPIGAEAKLLTRDEIAVKESEGWKIRALYAGGITNPWGTEEPFMPIVDEPTSLEVGVQYVLTKYEGGKKFSLSGSCAGEPVFLEIYKNNIPVDKSYGIPSDSNGWVKFTITFRESGYYTYKIFTQFQKQDNEIPPITRNCYVKSALTPTPTPTPTSTPTSTPSPTPEEGVPGFEAIFAITGLLVVAYLLRGEKIK